MNVRIMSALPRKNSSFFGITCGIFCRNFKEVGLGLSSPKAKVGRSNRLGRATLSFDLDRRPSCQILAQATRTPWL